MRESTAKSLKLNRDLDRYIEKGLQEDRPIKIGWGQAGDERPKKGEIGVITHLPKGARVLCLGDLGECAGSMNMGGNFTLRGGSSSMLGAYQKGGRTNVEKDAGSKVGYRMSGGEITVQGSVGDDSGSGMNGGTIVVRGHAGSRLGAGMEDGSIVVIGSVGTDPGVGMKGGRILVSGSCPPPRDGVLMRSIKKKEITEFAKLLEPIGASLNDDTLVLEPTGEIVNESSNPDRFVMEGFEKICLSPNSDPLPESSTLDHYTVILPSNSDSDGLLLPIPWIVKSSSAKEWEGQLSEKQPAIVSESPRDNDLLLISEQNLADSHDSLKNCSGVALDISDFPGLNDAEIEGLLVSLYSRMSDTSLVFLKGRVDRIENLFRLVIELELDGAIVDCSLPGGSRLSSTLPRIGLASKAMGLREQSKFIFLETTETPIASDLLIAVAAGCHALVSPCPDKEIEKVLVDLGNSLRGWMKDLGIESIERIGRRNLRAIDYDTASISGLRLVGYDRPLPMWLDLR